MSSGEFGQGPKKETIYGGPTPTAAQGTTYGGFSPTGTSSNGAPTAGTVYRPPVAQPTDSGAITHTHGHRAGGLFFLIAGLSVVNSVLVFVNAPFTMALGLGITLFFDGLASVKGLIGPAIAINVVVVGVFVLIGIFARKGSAAAILIGMILYAADTLLLLLALPATIILLLVHAYFLYALFGAYRASRS